MIRSLCLVLATLASLISPSLAMADLSVDHLRCEYLENPLGIDAVQPRLSWRVESEQRNQKQTAYQIVVASSPEKLAADDADMWDSGKTETSQTLFVPYSGKPLQSRSRCHWKVRVWDRDGQASSWSEPALWTVGLLNDSDWSADYISYKDDEAVHSDPSVLHLPPARQYRREFTTKPKMVRATVHATALGIYELHLNGKRVSDAYFAPGWTDYVKRAYVNTYDVTDLMLDGDNAIGAWVADGWYSGYVGFGLLTGMGTEKTGRATYGNTPSVMAQLEIEYADGSRQTIATDKSWKVTGDGPIREADLLMGEHYDATRQITGWSTPGLDDSGWESAILASENGSPKATFYEGRNAAQPGQGPRIEGEVKNLGFQRPELQSFPGVPVRITEELVAKRITPRESGSFIIDLGQNFAGVIRLKVKGPAGHRITIRYGEMLHPDGRLMTENLRKARATDTYVCSGDPNGEIYEPRFTFHGFQFVELSNFPGQPTLDTVTGLVMHSDTPMVSTFECSDPMVNQLFKNVLWTQRSNFLDLPTDCPQRDERMGWTGDAQAYVATAAYNADIGAFYTKWLRELMESQRPSGAFPGYAPFPFQHGWDFGSAWSDAGVICPWTIWQFYGDTQVIQDCWEPMTRFMDWRNSTAVDDLGIAHGNAWGDWLAQGAQTPLEFVDTVYYAISCDMMSEMAAAIGREEESKAYADQFTKTKAAFVKKYVREDGTLSVKTQTALALALFADLIPDEMRMKTGQRLSEMLADNGNHMATGFLGTRPLLPVLSSTGQNDLATFLLQSREFPSWGYEIENGATTIWERWDSYTREDAFGRHNAAMNSFSHYAFGAVCQWMFETLAGIRSEGPGFSQIVIEPHLPTPNSNGMHEPIDWVKASYESIRGTIRSDWKLENGKFFLNVEIPANTMAKVVLPTTNPPSIREGGMPIDNNPAVTMLSNNGQSVTLSIGSGRYEFVAAAGLQSSATPLKTSKPKDMSINPDAVDLAGATVIAQWNFNDPADVANWNDKKGVEVQQRKSKSFLVATGDDSQMWVSLPSDLTGKLAIELKAKPVRGVSPQFFWAGPKTGFNGIDQSKRALMATDQFNSYLYLVEPSQAINKLRFDPFESFDPYADRAEMEIESITIHQLAK